MAPPSQDAQSQPRRPAVLARHPSTSSYISQSPSDGHSSSHRAGPHKPQRHIVGQSRVGPRNASFGKNLNKLNKLTQTHGGDGTAVAKHHRRSHSGNSTSTPTSPRSGAKRNASTVGIVKNSSHTVIRKNHSSGHLPRQGSTKNMLKTTKSEIAPPKRSLAQPGKARHQSPDVPHPTVHFDIGNEEGHEEGHDDAWTEESASQSPTTTRSNTCSNSVIFEPGKDAQTSEIKNEASESTETEIQNLKYHTPPSPLTRHQPERSHGSRQTNGGSSYHQSRPPDADMITSRLLQRSASQNLPPQMSSISATVVSDSHDARSLSHSQGSTLADTPGKDLVSRFMDGDGSAGTPKDSNFLPSQSSPKAQSGDLDAQKWNRLAPNMTEPLHASHSRSQSRRSGTSTPTDLPPSRTQQKLLLQRASSNIEPQKLIPVILPRTGGPTLLQSGMTYAATSEGRIDPRLQQQFNQVSLEYKVVRRYRNPLADAIARIDQIPGSPRKTKVPRSPMTNGFVNVNGGEGLSSSFREPSSAGEGADRRRSRVSFEVARGARDDGDVEGRQSFGSDSGRVRNEVEEICRRLWESTEVAEGD